MTNTTDNSFTDEDIKAQAQGLISFLLIAGALYAKQQGKGIRDWAHFIGQAAAPSWDQEDHRNARATAMAQSLNGAASGMPIISITGDESHAELVTRDSNDFNEMIQQVGLPREEADEIYAIFEPIAAHLGLRFVWRREGDNLRMIFERQ